MIDETHVTFDVDGTAVSGVYTRPADAAGTIVVAHGAGAGMEHPFMSGFTRAMHGEGFATLRFNFPYREAKRRFPDRPPVAIATWRAAMDAAAGRAAEAGSPGEPIWASGKSFGGRMASMAVADGMAAAGLVFLGYPLHPPGRPEKARDEHLPGITVPMLFLQGRNDPFAVPNEQLDEVVARIGPTATLEWIEDANHSFEVKGAKRPAAEIAAGLAPRVAAFLRAHASGAWSLGGRVSSGRVPSGPVSSANRIASASPISRCRSRNARSSRRLRRSQPVTSSLHLLALHDPHAGATLSSVYRPPREIGSTQSRCSGRSVAPQ